jgi:hypothetical protein
MKTLVFDDTYLGTYVRKVLYNVRCFALRVLADSRHDRYRDDDMEVCS